MPAYDPKRKLAWLVSLLSWQRNFEQTSVGAYRGFPDKQGFPTNREGLKYVDSNGCNGVPTDGLVTDRACLIFWLIRLNKIRCPVLKSLASCQYGPCRSPAWANWQR